MAGVAITRTDLSAEELRRAASREKNARAARRMLALALVMEGGDRENAARGCGMDRQTLRDWVHRYNAEGLAGLLNRKPSGRPSTLSNEQKAKLVELVDQGPDPKLHNVVRWRRRDLAQELERLFGVKLHERSVGDVLAKLGYRRLSVRPIHPKADPARQETYKKTSNTSSISFCPRSPGRCRSKSGFRTRRALASKARLPAFGAG
jgi:transposase